MSLNFLATRFQCSWPWDILVMLCDGRIVCGCADPYGRRILGDATKSSIQDIWSGSTITALRQDLNNGGSSFCGDCPLKLPLKGQPPTVRALEVAAHPRRLYIECTAACNISCTDACCAPETGITRTRQAGMLDFGLFRRVVDEVGPSLDRIDFFNYGEAFLHKRAIEMCEYIKSRFPHVYLYTSTNGLAFSEDQARRLARSGIDEVTFSLDGATQQTYEKYRRRGNLEIALANLRAMVDEKRTAGRDLPFVNWRYILFTWNDADEEMNLARRLADEIGVDRLCWEITDHPEQAYSRRFAPGTAAFESIRRETWDDNNLGNAIPGATPRARIEVRGGFPHAPLVAVKNQELAVRAHVQNVSTRTFPATATYGRRFVRLGAQLCAADGQLVNRDFARADLPRALGPGDTADVTLRLPPLASAGRYRLKFDLVNEGVDWFERCGSETAARPLWVVS
jgi:hypothetical protein